MKLDFEQAKKILKESVENADTPLDMYIAFFDKIYEQGYKDGFSVIEDIKAEIRSIQPKWHKNAGKHNCIDDVIEIIDKHISGKESNGD